VIAAGSAVVAVVAVVGVALAVGAGDGSSPEAGATAGTGGVQGQEPAVGELPDLEFTRFRTGETDRLGAYEGRPLVINFFASWCAPCLAELPRFQQAYEAHKHEVAFLGMNLQDSRTSAAEVIRDTGLSYPIGVDRQGQLFQALGGYGMPTTLFVAADGTVLERHTGELSAEQLVDKLETHGMVNATG
jgi:cytochrome c biogenesis protein CcmG/thiol:disulfide interchange protein DsbE